MQVQIPQNPELLVFDCGTGFRNLGNEMHANGTPVTGKIFITHPHWDHMQGFPFFKPFYDTQNQFQVFLPPQENLGCRKILQGHLSNTFFPISIDMLLAELDCETFTPGIKEFGDWSVEYMWAHHTIPTAIYKLKTKGRSIVFAPDNELPDGNPDGYRFLTPGFYEDFLSFIKDADLLIHDGQYDRESYGEKRGWGHSAWQLVVEAAQKAKVKQLCLVHHDPDHSDDFLQKLDGQINQEYGTDFHKIWLAKEGQEIILPVDTSEEIMVSD